MSGFGFLFCLFTNKTEQRQLFALVIQSRVKRGCFFPKAIDLLSEKKYNYDELIIVVNSMKKSEKLT